MDAPTGIPAAFARRRALYRVVNAALIALLVAALVLAETAYGARHGLTRASLQPWLLGAAALSLAIRAWVWRCPGCGASLGRDVDPSVCPQCGAHLQGSAPQPPALSPREAEAIFEAYAARIRRQRVIIVTGLAAAFALLGGRVVAGARSPLPPAAWGGLFVGAIVVTGVAAWRNWRCPSCDRSWGRTVDMRCCPHCAVALEP